jgi:hypothetical protein
MAIVTVKNKFQVVIPQAIREKLGISRSDAPAWLKQIWAASKRNGTDKLTMQQINAEISAVRRERARKTKQPTR